MEAMARDSFRENEQHNKELRIAEQEQQVLAVQVMELKQLLQAEKENTALMQQRARSFEQLAATSEDRLAGMDLLY